MKSQLPTEAFRRVVWRACSRAQKRGAREHGFTLIELLVVMIIIAILMAVAVPIFLSTKQKATASKAKQQAVNADKALKACAASNPTGEFLDRTESGHNCFDPLYWEEADKGMYKLLEPNCYAPASFGLPSPTQCVGGFGFVGSEVTLPGSTPMPSSYQATSEGFIYSLSDSPDAPVAYVTNPNNGERWCIRQLLGDVNDKKQRQMCPVWPGEHPAVGKW